MYLLHEIFDVGLWDVKFLKLFDGLFVYSPSDSGCDRDEGFCVSTFFCISLINGSYLACFCVMVCYGNRS